MANWQQKMECWQVKSSCLGKQLVVSLTAKLLYGCLHDPLVIGHVAQVEREDQDLVEKTVIRKRNSLKRPSFRDDAPPSPLSPDTLRPPRPACACAGQPVSSCDNANKQTQDSRVVFATFPSFFYMYFHLFFKKVDNCAHVVNKRIRGHKTGPRFAGFFLLMVSTLQIRHQMKTNITVCITSTSLP